MGKWADSGYEYLYGGDFDKALEHFRKGVEESDPDACYGIVELYESCKPADPDAKAAAEKESVQMCARAMLLDHRKAPYTLSCMDSEWKMYATAYCKENGIGHIEDITEAVRLYEQDAEAGGYHAMMRLYQIYKDGLHDIPADEEKAARYLFMSGYGRT